MNVDSVATAVNHSLVTSQDLFVSLLLVVNSQHAAQLGSNLP